MELITFAVEGEGISYRIRDDAQMKRNNGQN